MHLLTSYVNILSLNIPLKFAMFISNQFKEYSIYTNNYYLLVKKKVVIYIYYLTCNDSKFSHNG